ncbi:hypothetical protein [Ensifer sp. LCM 4579]|uniref:DUF7706 family protein n=1 Tax=Ensifer sp. LCM 4579 TaxID=1848292 RepID=UPI0008D9829A|nr:hypothetical protein [Ensifer sp. LCM 4579]OHV80385.1 hypothetical protein LCM4579_22635 [Ensifer sp. LCM 4579]
MKNKITVELNADQAWAFAEFLKRVSREDFERRAVDRNEADLMWEAGICLREALGEQGFAPR